LALLAVVAGPAVEAAGHGRSVSYSSWELDGESAVVTLRLKLLELSRLGPEALPPGRVPGLRSQHQRDLPAEFLPRDLILTAEGRPCNPEERAQLRPDEPGWARYEWRIRCPTNSKTFTIRSQILLDVAPSHIHFARVSFGDEAGQIREQILTETSPTFAFQRPSIVDANSRAGSSFGDYLDLGVRHILSGWDHLAFVFGLLLLATRFGEVARLITGFSIAHSLTLALAVQGLVEPRAAVVEAVIAFSIALVAIEKVWIDDARKPAYPVALVLGLSILGLSTVLGVVSLPLMTCAGLALFTACYFGLASRSDNPWLRVLLTFAFGLVHGFGFAGILQQMTLPTDRLIPALLGFNLGVEIGQIALVLLLWPLLRWGKTVVSVTTAQWASSVSSAGLCGLGLYWLIQRAA
jgi:hypothetical protein